MYGSILLSLFGKLSILFIQIMICLSLAVIDNYNKGVKKFIINGSDLKMLYKIKKQLKKSKLIRTSYSNLINIYNKYVLTDIRFIQKSFVRNIGRQVNLESPKDFRDKLQWLKLYWYDPQAIKCADKYQVREFIKKEVGHEYLNELYA